MVDHDRKTKNRKKLELTECGGHGFGHFSASPSSSVILTNFLDGIFSPDMPFRGSFELQLTAL